MLGRGIWETGEERRGIGEEEGWLGWESMVGWAGTIHTRDALCSFRRCRGGGDGDLCAVPEGHSVME